MGKPPDIFIIDYIQLLQYVQNRKIRLDNATSMIDYFMRQLTMACQNMGGHKMAGLVLAQTNRDGYRRAQENNGKYDLLALSESRELERSSFAVMFLYSDESLAEGGEVKICLPKNRGGRPIQEPFLTQVDPVHCVMGDAINGLSQGMGAGGLDFSSLLSPFSGFGAPGG